MIGRLRCFRHKFSEICDGSKDFAYVLCDFRSGAPFSQTEGRCRCVNSLLDVVVTFALLFLSNVGQKFG